MSRLVVPSSLDFSNNTVSSSSHVGSLHDLSSVTRLVCWLAASKRRISDFFACSVKLYVDTEYRILDASEFGEPSDLRGASRSTFGVNLAALIVIMDATRETWAPLRCVSPGFYDIESQT